MKSILSGLISALSGLKPALTDSRSERADFGPERAWGGWTDGQTDGRTDERKYPCVLQDFVPFGAAAQKGKPFENLPANLR